MVTSPRSSMGPRLVCSSSLGFVIKAFLLIAFLSSTSGPQSALFAAANPLSNPQSKNYALIAGTVWGPDDREVYGVLVKIRRATDKPKKVRWQVYSDHRGEFAQRVPVGEADYILSADLKGFKTTDGRPLRLVKEVTVHIYHDEREDTGLHLTIDGGASAASGSGATVP
jgi:hypothetical protein